MFKVYNLFTEEEADNLVKLLNQTKAWKEGKARTKELTGTIKKNLEIDRGHPISLEVSKIITKKLLATEDFKHRVFPAKMCKYKFNNYKSGGTYNRHTDAAFMGDTRTDLASTMFLTDPDSYRGGELCIEQPDGTIIKHKGKKGDCVVYNCGAPHWVSPVTKGKRISGITWIQSTIEDERKRDLIALLRTIELELESKTNYKSKKCPYRKWMTDLCKLDNSLTKMWSK